MLDRVARLPGAPCLLAWSTPLGGVAFYHVKGSCQAIPANRGEINHKNMVMPGELFCSYHLPMLSDEQNVNVIDESQAENRPAPTKEAEYTRWKKVSLVSRSFCCA